MSVTARAAQSRLLRASTWVPRLWRSSSTHGASTSASHIRHVPPARVMLSSASFSLATRAPWRAPILPHSARPLSSTPENRGKQTSKGKGVVVREEEDPFDSITDKIPQRPVTVAEASSYSVVILAGLGLAAVAAYAVIKELLLEKKEYTVFGRALKAVQGDNRITMRLGTPITGYGQDSMNRAARQRISHRIVTDEDGTERIQVQFHVRGPRGAGLVHTEMFKDRDDRGRLKFTYLIVDITSPAPARIMLESYMPSQPQLS